MPSDLSTQESAPIDLQELIERCMGNLELAERVLSKLQSRFDEDMARLEQALSAKDGQLIASIAHRLKGASANVAAHDLQKCAAEIEELANQDILADLPVHLEILRHQWSRLNDSNLLSGMKSHEDTKAAVGRRKASCES
jgi:HPt (histidine-containing phosphotransfer) domain-containing protein